VRNFGSVVDGCDEKAGENVEDGCVIYSLQGQKGGFRADFGLDEVRRRRYVVMLML
jgi:hypothetical protein